MSHISDKLWKAPRTLDEWSRSSWFSRIAHRNLLCNTSKRRQRYPQLWQGNAHGSFKQLSTQCCCWSQFLRNMPGYTFYMLKTS